MLCVVSLVHCQFVAGSGHQFRNAEGSVKMDTYQLKLGVKHFDTFI